MALRLSSEAQKMPGVGFVRWSTGDPTSSRVPLQSEPTELPQTLQKELRTPEVPMNENNASSLEMLWAKSSFVHSGLSSDSSFLGFLYSFLEGSVKHSFGVT